MTTALEARNIADHISNALPELELALKDAQEAGDEDADNLQDIYDMLVDMRDDLREEQDRPDLRIINNEDDEAGSG